MHFLKIWAILANYHIEIPRSVEFLERSRGLEAPIRCPEKISTLRKNQPLGFSSRASLVRDACRHGVEVGPVDVYVRPCGGRLAVMRELSNTSAWRNFSRSSDVTGTRGVGASRTSRRRLRQKKRATE